MPFNVTVILIASTIVVGLVELIKVFLPENFNSKILAAISLAVSIGAGIGISFAFGLKTAIEIISNTFAVVGLVQTSYNFVLKLFRMYIEKIKAGIEAGITDK